MTLAADALWHTGTVVEDIDTAKAELGERLGVTWYEGGAEIQLLTDDGEQTVRSAYALSKEGPHHIELCQAVPGTVWTVPGPGHAHHLGYWVDDVAGATAALVAAGSPHVASVAIGGRPPMCAYHRTDSGLLVEVVDVALKPIFLPGS